MPEARPATLASRLAETGGYGLATLLLVATLIATGWFGTGPLADAIGLAAAVGALLVVLRTATSRGRARLAIVAAAGLLAVVVVAADVPGLRPFAWLAWLTVVAIGTLGLVATAADVLGSRRALPRLVAGLACLYTILGFTFANLYGLLERATGEPALAQREVGRFTDFLYFSFATLTTTGFGDLSGAGDAVRMLSVMEALVGQLYLVVILGALVGASMMLPQRLAVDPAPDRPGRATDLPGPAVSPVAAPVIRADPPGPPSADPPGPPSADPPAPPSADPPAPAT